MENFSFKDFHEDDKNLNEIDINQKLSLELDKNKENRSKKEFDWYKWIENNKEIIEQPLSDPSLLEAIGSLTFKIKEYLPEYDTIISDDTSGRVPSLVLRNVASATNEKKGGPKTYFITGGARLKEYEENRSFDDLDKSINDFINKRKDEIKNPLVVTEVISSGKSLEAFLKRFHKFDIYPDIATLSTYQFTDLEGEVLENESNDKFNEYAKELKTRIFYGKKSGVGETIHGHFKGKGVKKQKTGIFKRIRSPHPEAIKDDKVGDVRRSIKLISNGLIDVIKE